MSSNSQESTDSTASSPCTVPPVNTNNKAIKERLNMHLKRRIQETADKKDGGETSATAAATAHTSTPASTGCKTPKKSKNALHKSTESIDEECDSLQASCFSPTSSRHSQDRSPDLLTMVLNHKKSALLMDPEILKLIQK